MRRTAARHGYVIPEFSVTRALVIVNVVVYLAELLTGAGINADSGWIFQHGALVINGGYVGHQLVPVHPGTSFQGVSLIGLAHGEWYRLITAAFLHYGPIHLGMNMLALWWLGQPVEAALGRARFALIYLVAGLAGSTGRPAPAARTRSRSAPRARSSGSSARCSSSSTTRPDG